MKIIIKHIKLLKDVLVNVFLLLIMLAVSTFITMVFIAVDVNTYLYILGGVDLLLLILYPIRLCILDIIWDFKWYWRNRPVKVLHYIKL